LALAETKALYGMGIPKGNKFKYNSWYFYRNHMFRSQRNYFHSFLFGVLLFELKASHLLGRPFTTWATPSPKVFSYNI
jgi:hypothetical protein